MTIHNFPAPFPGTDSRILRTLALLKVAEVIARDKFEKAYNAVKFRQVVTKNSPVHLVNAKFDTRSSSNNSRAFLSSKPKFLLKKEQRNYSVAGN